MNNFIKTITTDKGKKQIDYEALANLPVSDKELLVDGNFADAKIVGDKSKLKIDSNKVYDKETADSKFLTKEENKKGTVTSIVAGEGLDGGMIMESGTISHSNPVGASEGDKGSENTNEVLKSITTDRNGHVTGFKTKKNQEYDLTSMKHAENDQVEIILSKSDDNNDIVTLKGEKNIILDEDDKKNIIIDYFRLTRNRLNLELSKKLDKLNIENAQATDLLSVRKKPDGSLWTSNFYNQMFKLTVKSDPECIVEISNDITTIRKNTSGICEFLIPYPSKWKIQVIKNDQTKEIYKERVINVFSDVEINLATEHHICTVRVEYNNPSLINEIQNVGFMNNVAREYSYHDEGTSYDTETKYLEYFKQTSYGNKIYWPYGDLYMFRNIRPCIVKDGIVKCYLEHYDLTKILNSGVDSVLDDPNYGDVMLEIPKMGYRLWKEDNYQYVSVTDEPNNPNYCYLAHSLEEEGDCDKIYVGLFLSSKNDIDNKLYSLAYKTPFVSTIMEARELTASKGYGYGLMTYGVYVLLQCFYYIFSLDDYLIYVSHKPYRETGFSIKTKNPDIDSFLNIEALFGDNLCFVDGINTTLDGYIKIGFKNFNNTGEGYPYSYFVQKITTPETAAKMGYMKTFIGTDPFGFIIDQTISGNPHRSEYYGETYQYIAFWAKENCAYFGLNFMGGNIGTDVNYPNLAFASRMMYRHKA